MGWVDNFRLMWLENSVKYLKPFSPQPTQFPEKPAGDMTERELVSYFWQTLFTVQCSCMRSTGWQQGPKTMLMAICLLHSYLRAGRGAHWPKSAFFPFSSGKKRRSTAHTRMCSGTLGDLAPTSSKPAGTSMGSVAMETRRRSLPAWQNPEGRGGEETDEILDEIEMFYSCI